MVTVGGANFENFGTPWGLVPRPPAEAVAMRVRLSSGESRRKPNDEGRADKCEEDDGDGDERNGDPPRRP